VTLSLIPGAAHIDLGRTILGLLLFLLFSVSLNGALIAPFLSADPEFRVRCVLGATSLWIIAFLDALRISGMLRKPIRAGGDVFAAACSKAPDAPVEPPR
jgi:MFS-type transporter involved in bile tolerance (Atg22 family)